MNKNNHVKVMEKSKNYSFEIGPIRPPNEGGSHSLLLRPTRNCPWNKCAFCITYKGKKFQIRRVEEIKADIDAAKAISEELREGSIDPGLAPRQCLAVVHAWLRSGGKTAFLQDSNSLLMRTSQLVEVIRYLRETFPSLERVTSYARSKTLYRKSLEELKEIREAGLSRLHVGLETGDDELLERIRKGVTADEHVEGGKKAMEAGFELSEYVMPGLGGRSQSKEHSRNTARVLNEIDPDFIRMRPLVPIKGTKLFEEYESGNFQISSPHDRLEELKDLLERLEVTGRLCFDHVMNGWHWKSGEPLFDRDYDGYKLPEEKDLVLELIDEGLKIDESNHIDARDLVEFVL